MQPSDKIDFSYRPSEGQEIRIIRRFGAPWPEFAVADGVRTVAELVYELMAQYLPSAQLTIETLSDELHVEGMEGNVVYVRFNPAPVNQPANEPKPERVVIEANESDRKNRWWPHRWAWFE